MLQDSATNPQFTVPTSLRKHVRSGRWSGTICPKEGTSRHTCVWVRPCRTTAGWNSNTAGVSPPQGPSAAVASQEGSEDENRKPETGDQGKEAATVERGPRRYRPGERKDGSLDAGRRCEFLTSRKGACHVFSRRTETPRFA